MKVRKAGEAIIRKKKNDCHLKNTGYIALLYAEHILRAFMFITCAIYKVSMFKPVTWRSVQR